MTTSKEELRRQLNSWLIEANGSGTASCPLCNTHPDRICIWHSARLDNLLHLITTYGIEEREDEMVRLKNAGGAKGYGSHLIIDYADGRIAELTKLKGEK